MNEKYFELLKQSCDEAKAFAEGDKSKCSVRIVNVADDVENSGTVCRYDETISVRGGAVFSKLY